MIIDHYGNNWASNGYTIIADGWIDNRQRTLINFLVYCPIGLFFIKSVDASSVVTNAKHCSLFEIIVEWVGPKNVVHIITDNTSNYVISSALLKHKYVWIYWPSCVVHCLNLMSKGIACLPHIMDLVAHASKLTGFVYNHSTFLHWLRRRKNWKEIMRLGATNFATTFTSLKYIYDHKHDLQAS